MTYRKSFGFVLIVIGAAAWAQQPASAPPSSATPAAPAASSAASSSASSTADKPEGPSPELLKKARMAGYKAETQKGVTKFCRRDADLGTRFETKKCVSQDQMEQEINERQDARNELSKAATCTGAHCGN